MRLVYNDNRQTAVLYFVRNSIYAYWRNVDDVVDRVQSGWLRRQTNTTFVGGKMTDITLVHKCNILIRRHDSTDDKALKEQYLRQAEEIVKQLEEKE